MQQTIGSLGFLVFFLKLSRIAIPGIGLGCFGRLRILEILGLLGILGTLGKLRILVMLGNLGILGTLTRLGVLGRLRIFGILGVLGRLGRVWVWVSVSVSNELCAQTHPILCLLSCLCLVIFIQKNNEYITSMLRI